MRIIYPYNEILPKKAAHDVYLFNECCALAKQGIEVSLLCGNSPLENSSLHAHYQTDPSTNFLIRRFPIIRKNNFLGLSWNFPFFFFCQREISLSKPHFVFLSVQKQAAYHLQRKVQGVRYLYEVHQLNYYPTLKAQTNEVEKEKKILENADLLTVTTEALQEILRNPPYSLKIPIHVIPLAVKTSPLPPPSKSSLLTVAYVGQLYEGQGVDLLIQSLQRVPSLQLKIIGGKTNEVEALKKHLRELKLLERVQCLGFHSPSALAPLLKDVHAFVAPFEANGRMPYVAHTKLLEYAEWGRPIIAPDLPIVREHFKKGQGVEFFTAGNANSLSSALSKLNNPTHLSQLQEEIHLHSGHFSWEKRAKHYLKVLAS